MGKRSLKGFSFLDYLSCIMFTYLRSPVTFSIFLVTKSTFGNPLHRAHLTGITCKPGPVAGITAIFQYAF